MIILLFIIKLTNYNFILLTLINNIFVLIVFYFILDLLYIFNLYVVKEIKEAIA
jgi:hypothetical protein